MKDHRRLAITTSILVVLLLVVGAVVAFNVVPRVRGLNSSDASSWMKGVALPPDTDKRDDAFRSVSKDAPIPDTDVLASRLNSLLAAAGVEHFTGSVQDAMTGKDLWRKNSDKSLQSASVMKLLTAQAALRVLSDEQRVKTETLLLNGDTVVLRGYGDVTLSDASKGQDSFYHGAARIEDLAQHTETMLRKRGITVRKLIVDTSLYRGSTMAPGWNTEDIGGGSIAPMSPTMVNGARLDATGEDSPRTVDPAMQVGRALAQHLGIAVDNVTVTSKKTNTSTVLGRVWSAPLITRLHDVLIHSDNVLAEAIGREIAVQQGKPATFAGATESIRHILGDNGVTTVGLTMFDASGLSLKNRVSSHTLVDVLRLSATQDQNRAILDDLPVSGGSGTLSNRFYDGSLARGWVRAKTGTLSSASSLAGIVVTRDGRVLVFAFIINGEEPSAARPVLDALATSLQACGCQPAH